MKAEIGFEDGFVELTQHRLHFLSAGSGDAVIFLHGWGADASSFLFAANEVSAFSRAVLVDFAGFGKSEEPKTPFTVRDHAADVLALMDFLGIERASFVCHSFGGRVGIEIASARSERVDKLVLIDSAGMKPRRGLKYYARVYLHKALKAFGLKGLKGSDDYSALSPVMKETFKNVVNYDQFPLLCHILCPTLIFWGKKDRETPIYMARRLQTIADSALIMLDGGHFAYAQDSGKFLTVLTAFLRSRP